MSLQPIEGTVQTANVSGQTIGNQLDDFIGNRDSSRRVAS